MKQIPYIIHEAAMQRLRDSLRRTQIALLIIMALLTISNIMWFLK